MASHQQSDTIAADERTQLGGHVGRLLPAAGLTGAAGLAVAIALAFFGHDGARRFYFTYLVSFAFFLSLALGATFFVLVQYLVRSGWSVAVRRIAENISATMPVLAVLSLPILMSVASQNGKLYGWAVPASAPGAVSPENPDRAEETADRDKSGEAKTADPAAMGKRVWLNPNFFIARVVIYFAVWCGIGLYYRRQSVLQDQTGDPQITARLQAMAGPLLALFGFTLTFAAFDLIMSLDWTWYSTIFGVYYFAGCTVGFFATLLLTVYLLQRQGLLNRSVSIEHYHDMGKYLFGFTFFWGYIAFSQYMLLWYGSIPEEVKWLSRHGATTASGFPTRWSAIAIALLLGNLLIPFAGLMSRHVKRRPTAVVFWAIWLLMFHWVDLQWLIMPEMSKGPMASYVFGLADLAPLLGIGGIMVCAWVYLASRASLRPMADPRLSESLAFQNI